MRNQDIWGFFLNVGKLVLSRSSDKIGTIPRNVGKLLCYFLVDISSPLKKNLVISLCLHGIQVFRPYGS
jgi:hypothetical protein